MLTCCPHCRTYFRVAAAQLKIRRGQVRCGACREVFDALDSLADETHFVPEPVPESASVPAAPAPPRRWPWVSGIVILLLVALGQLAYIFRSEIAVVAPELRPVLEAGCTLLGCRLARPVRPELIGIESSELVPEGTSLLLAATLKNRAPFAQDFPHLELTLTDTQDAALVRKILTPADYLPAGRDAAQGFAPLGELALRLRLTTEGVPAVGYRLYLFFP